MNEAADGVDVIFHAVSFSYQEWDQKHLYERDGGNDVFNRKSSHTKRRKV